MNGPTPSTAARLRADFDAAFAETPRPPRPGGVPLLALRLGGRPYALRLAQVASLAPGRALLPVPGAAAAFLGLAGQRGGLWPVWDLGALLGHPSLKGAPRWLALAAGGPPWAAAFDHFDGYLCAEPGDLRPLAGGEAAAFAQEACAAHGAPRPVLRLEALRASIQATLRPTPTKETEA